MSDTQDPRQNEADNTADILEEIYEDGFSLSDENIAAIHRALDTDDNDSVKALLSGLSEADIADILHKIDRESRRVFLERFGRIIDPYVFVHLDSSLRTDILSDMPPLQVAHIISDLDSDDALDLIIDLEEDFQKQILRGLSAKNRIVLEEGLTFPEQSAGRLMQREYVAIPQFWTVGKTIDYMRATSDELPDDFSDLIVIDPSYHVVGTVPLNKLVRARRSEKVESLINEDIQIIPALMDQEEAAHLFRREGIGSAPVVDEDGRLIGVITVDDVIDVIDEEAEEDILKLAGVGESDLYSAVTQTSFSRSKWLAVNLVTAFMAAAVVSFFGETIEKAVALAALMPIVAGMGGNAGTQALTVTVRAIAVRELSDTNALRAILKEALVGLINGILFAIIVGLIAGFWFHSPVIGCVIAAALVINLLCAGAFGAGIPFLLHRFGQDPAISSSVFLTMMTDVIGFFAFLGLASLFLV